MRRGGRGTSDRQRMVVVTTTSTSYHVWLRKLQAASGGGDDYDYHLWVCRLTQAEVDVAVVALGALVVHHAVQGPEDGGGARAAVALAGARDAHAPERERAGGHHQRNEPTGGVTTTQVVFCSPPPRTIPAQSKRPTQHQPTPPPHPNSTHPSRHHYTVARGLPRVSTGGGVSSPGSSVPSNERLRKNSEAPVINPPTAAAYYHPLPPPSLPLPSTPVPTLCLSVRSLTCGTSRRTARRSWRRSRPHPSRRAGRSRRHGHRCRRHRRRCPVTSRGEEEESETGSTGAA